MTLHHFRALLLRCGWCFALHISRAFQCEVVVTTPQKKEGKHHIMKLQWSCRLCGLCGWLLLMLILFHKLVSVTQVSYVENQSWEEALQMKVMLKPDKPIPPVPIILSSVQEWESVTEKRNQLLASVCKNTSLRNLMHVSVDRFVLDRIFVSDKHKILFCQTPKVDNTQWKKVLIVLTGAFSTVEEIPEDFVHANSKNDLTRLSSLAPEEIQHRLQTYFKFFFVRDPLERLISAFKDKFKHNPRNEPWYTHDIAPAIIANYRKSSRAGDPDASDLKFEDFVRYLGDVEHRQLLDQQFGEPIIHWVTYVELCAPCEINYDVIGHHETLEQDAPHILRAAGIDKLVSYPAIPPGITRYNKTKVQSYFSGISKEDIRRLYARYQGDFELFGYPRPDFLLD